MKANTDHHNGNLIMIHTGHNAQSSLNYSLNHFINFNTEAEFHTFTLSVLI